MQRHRKACTARLLLRIIVNAVALWVTTFMFASIRAEGENSVVQVLIVTIVFGLVNAFIKPVFKLLALSISILTQGLSNLAINALMLNLTAWILPALSIDAGGILGTS